MKKQVLLVHCRKVFDPRKKAKERKYSQGVIGLDIDVRSI